MTHTALGIAIGSIIEGLLPNFNEGASVASQAFEALVQVGLNGAALAGSSAFLRDNDPTFGIPFSMALYASQPELRARSVSIGAEAKSRVASAAQQMRVHAAAQ